MTPSLHHRVALRCVASCGLTVSFIATPLLAEDGRPAGPEVAGTLAIQFTDRFLHEPGWRTKLDRAAELGATVVRVDLNWPWTETEVGRYDWSVYDGFAAELRKRKLRPLFILHRPNPLHGRSEFVIGDGSREVVTGPPRNAVEIAAFARWAAAAAVHFRSVEPIWEIWNEPDGEGFWPPKPNPNEYVRLARAACDAIKQAVPNAFVTGPAAAEMPTIWEANKSLVTEVLKDPELARCLSAISLHTHRFGQPPETVSRDYAVYRREITDLAGRALPILDTEWGDSVFRGGLSEDRQARWLPRMVLTNLLEGVSLTNWYCLFDTGESASEREDRFGLVTQNGRLRPAYRAYQALARALRGYSLRQVIARFDRETAEGTTILLFCDLDQHCKLAAWTTEEELKPVQKTIRGWTLVGSISGHLGQTLPSLEQEDTSVTLSISPDVQFVGVKPVHAAARQAITP